MKTQLLALGAVLALPFSAISASVAASHGAGEVVIVNTGDRLTPGYRATVGPTGRLTAVLNPIRGQKPIRRTNSMIPATRQRFFADLAKAEPLNRLSVGATAFRGGARISGPQVFVRFHGQQSPNLRDAQSASGRDLYQDVKQILQVLRLPIPDVP